jgi:[acyl-carrier-protein] S-malonyltransferase
MMRAFIFPGQGSQKVGMGAELAEASAAARDVFGEVNEALKQELSALMFAGPEDDLTLTENAQPAIMAHSIAAMRVLERDFGVTLAAHGHWASAAAALSGLVAAWQPVGACGRRSSGSDSLLRGQRQPSGPDPMD